MTNQYSYAEDFAHKAHKPAQKQADPNISSAAKVYMISRIQKENAAKGYRNGEYKGSKYMTAEDFVTYFHSRGKTSSNGKGIRNPSESSAGEILRARPEMTNAQQKCPASAKADTVPNVTGAVKLRSPESKKVDHADRDDGDVRVYTPNKHFRRSSKGTEATGVFNRASGDKIKKIKEVANEWLPEEKIVDVKVKRSPRRMVKMALAVASVAVSLMMIVGGSVLVSDAERETKELERELKNLELERSELSLELDMKNDINVLKERATGDLGMIRKEYVDATYLDVSGDDSVQVYEDENDDKVGLSAILSAFGIG